MKMSRPLTLTAMLVVLVIGPSACTSVTDDTATISPPSATTTASDPSESPSEDDTVVDEPEAPPVGTPAAVAWEALMGPDGEYAASAMYLAIIDEFGDVEPYVSIQAAEERHSEALIRQLSMVGVDAPENPYIGEIEPPEDLEGAASAGAEGEVANIEMYDRLLTQTDDARLTRVLTNLRSASADVHLPAFEAAADNGGVLTPEQMLEFRRGPR